MSQTETKDSDNHDEAPKTESTTSSSSPSCEESEKPPTEESASKGSPAEKADNKDSEDESPKAASSTSSNSLSSEELEKPPTEASASERSKAEDEDNGDKGSKASSSLSEESKKSPTEKPANKKEDKDKDDEGSKAECPTGSSSSSSSKESKEPPTEKSLTENSLTEKVDNEDGDEEGSKAEIPTSDSSSLKESKEPSTEKAPILTEKVETKNMNNQDQKHDLRVDHGDASEVQPTYGILIVSDAANTSPIKEVDTEGVQKATDAKTKVFPASKEDEDSIERLRRKKKHVSGMIARLRENSEKGQQWDYTVLPCNPTSELWIAELTCQNFYKVSKIKSEGKKEAKNETEKAKEEEKMKERRIFRACSKATISKLDAYEKVIPFLETELRFDDKLQKLIGMHYSLLYLRIEYANNCFSLGRAKGL
jgi:hypothetical protein